jgi:hypothetical protein
MSKEIGLPAERDLPAGRLQRRKEHLVRELTFSPSRRRRRFVLGALVPAVLLLLGATGVATYVLTRPATQLESVGCYDRLDLEANTTVVAADGRDPVAICAQLWEEGAVGSGPTPALAACVLESGAVGVFPRVGEMTCNSLGLATLGSDYSARVGGLAELRAKIVARLAVDCLDGAESRALVERQLAAQGLAGWRVEIAGNGFGADRRCAELGTDAGQKIALLIPVEPVKIACYERADLPSRFVLVEADGTDPVVRCRNAWQEGRLTGAPPAVACLLHGSAAGVFPAAEPGLCERLGPAVSPLPRVD